MYQEEVVAPDQRTPEPELREVPEPELRELPEEAKVKEGAVNVVITEKEKLIEGGSSHDGSE